jgi:hypothetical protein
MYMTIESAELLRIINRHKAKLLTSLEEINCPTAYLSVIRNQVDYLRNDLLQAGENNEDAIH